jgi:hypothetical protein
LHSLRELTVTVVTCRDFSSYGEYRQQHRFREIGAGNVGTKRPLIAPSVRRSADHYAVSCQRRSTGPLQTDLVCRSDKSLEQRIMAITAVGYSEGEVGISIGTQRRLPRTKAQTQDGRIATEPMA